MPVVGALTAVKSGHAMNQALVKKVLADPTCHRIVRVSEAAEATAARIAIPSLGLEGQAA
jgi:UDP-3-O-[3-hydroxymyristoyl] N-acetylglucosamine deacetylase